jgi:hypothetical protein
VDGKVLSDQPGLSVLATRDVSEGLSFHIIFPFSTHSLSISESESSGGRVGLDTSSVKESTISAKHKEFSVSANGNVLTDSTVNV